ncbi:MAG: MlaD family protein [Bacteroidales bacterium]|nr:MlaD family protein [Bacteroidales bacterium]
MRKEVKLGITAIIAIAILVYGLNFFKNIEMLHPKNTYYVEFADVTGVAESGPVFWSGLQVGIVREMRYNPTHPGYVVVRIETAKNLLIPTGTTAELETEMLGSVRMHLRPNYSSSTCLQPGDTIPGRGNGGLLAAASEKILPAVERMMPKLDSILSSLNRLLADPALANTLHNTERATAHLAATSKQLDALMKTDVTQMADNLTRLSGNMEAMTSKLKDFDFDRLMQNVNSTIEHVELFANRLNDPQGSWGLLLNDAQLYNNLNATAGNAALLLEDLRMRPKRYVHFSIFGRKDKTADGRNWNFSK